MDLARLIAENETAVRRWVARRVADTADAEDVAQEIFCAAIAAWPRFRAEASPRTWLYSICRHQLCHYYRRRRCERSRHGVHTDGDRDACGLDASLPNADCSESDRQLLAHAVTLLPYRLRMLHELRHEQGLPVKTIADLVRLPEGTVKYHLYRLRAELRRLIG